jgi:hypothetical protein
MSKKSRFWGNFWGETGRNSGKWLSNKVFGNAGWATPRRHIFGDDSTNEKKSKNRSSSPSASYSEKLSQDLQEAHRIALREKELNFKLANQEKILEMAKNTKFTSSNVDNICSTLDELFLGAAKATNFMEFSSFNDNVFAHKIKAGIMRLNRLQEYEMAEFYSQQLKGLKKAHFKKHTLPFIFLIVILLLSIYIWVVIFL